jgi:hypothetical protein
LTYFNYGQLSPQRAKIMADANVANGKKAEHRNTYEKAVFSLANSMVIYERIKNSFQPEHSHDFAKVLEQFAVNVKALRASTETAGSTENLDEKLVQPITEAFRGFEMMSALGYPLAVPPPSDAHDRELWNTMGGSLTNSVALRSASFHPAVTFYASALSAYRQDKAADFNDAIAGYQAWLAQHQFQKELAKGQRELFFNNYAPFKTLSPSCARLFPCSCRGRLCCGRPLVLLR